MLAGTAPPGVSPGTLRSPLLALAVTVLIGIACSWRWAKTRCGAAGVLLGADQVAVRLGELMVKATPLLLIALGLAVCFPPNPSGTSAPRGSL